MSPEQKAILARAAGARTNILGSSVAGRARDIKAIEMLSEDFGYHLDRGDADGFAALFTEDAVYTNGPRRSDGQAAIRAFFEARAQEPRTSRHLHGPIRIAFEGPDRATGLSVWTTYSAPGLPPIATTIPVVVADVEDVYLRNADRWRIAERHIKAIFTTAATPRK